MGWGAVASRTRGPPPLIPPHKGEGNTTVRNIASSSSITDAAPAAMAACNDAVCARMRWQAVNLSIAGQPKTQGSWHGSCGGSLRTSREQTLDSGVNLVVNGAGPHSMWCAMGSLTCHMGVQIHGKITFESRETVEPSRRKIATARGETQYSYTRTGVAPTADTRRRPIEGRGNRPVTEDDEPKPLRHKVIALAKGPLARSPLVAMRHQCERHTSQSINVTVQFFGFRFVLDFSASG